MTPTTTPGPWKIWPREAPNDYGTIICDGIQNWSVVPDGPQLTAADDLADMTLIAAAPDLLAALLGVQAAWDQNRLLTSDEAAAVREALAKAQGAA